MSNTFFVYLSGPIAGLTYEKGSDWREYATQALPPHIQGISPLRGHEMLTGMGPILNNMMDHPMRTDAAINRRDKFDTLRADALLVNLLGATKVSIGTVMEIAWAHDHGIPVVVAMEPEGNPHDHPMVRDSISMRFSSLDEAIEGVVSWVSPHRKFNWTRLEQVHMLREEGLLNTVHDGPKENYGGRTH